MTPIVPASTLSGKRFGFVTPALGLIVTLACSKSSNMTAQNGGDASCPTMDAAVVDTPAPTDTGSTTDADPLSGLPTAAQITLTTLYKSPLVIEGLTADSAGNLYAAGRGGTPCAVWRVPSAGGAATLVGNIAAPCSPNGLAFNATGDLFIADADRILKLTPSDQTPSTAAVFATGVPGANGVAFDRTGNLWVSDGVTGQGRVWKITADGTVSLAFRVQPLANDVNVMTGAGADAGTDGGGDAGTGPLTGGVGRDPRALPPGSLTFTAAGRTAADTAGSVAIVANGLAFASDGSLFVADTGRGAIWKVTLNAQGNVQSPVGCDTTFTPDTLCLPNVFVAHPILEGLDGIALDAAGDIWGVANERNAIVVVTARGIVREVFRSPPDATTKLRNAGPLEFPTSPFLVDKKLCVTQSDVSRRDNFPNAAGEVGPGVTGPLLGKISCVEQSLPQAGLRLPVP